jgi:RES domain-containing protein
LQFGETLAVYRVCKLRYADLTGIGASRDGGRWNPPGQRAVYTSTELSNAFIESFSHLARNSIPEPLGRMYIELDLRECYIEQYITEADPITGAISTKSSSTEPEPSSSAFVGRASSLSGLTRMTLELGKLGVAEIFIRHHAAQVTQAKPLITIFNHIEVATQYYKMLETFSRQAALFVPSAVNPVYNAVLFPSAPGFRSLINSLRVEQHEIHPSLLDLLNG